MTLREINYLIFVFFCSNFRIANIRRQIMGSKDADFYLVFWKMEKHFPLRLGLRAQWRHPKISTSAPLSDITHKKQKSKTFQLYFQSKLQGFSSL